MNKRVRNVAVVSAISLGLMLTLSGNAGCIPSPAGNSALTEQNDQEANQAHLDTVLPPPKLDTSGERANLIKRLERLNTENMSGYVYLFTEQGTMIAFYPVKGKVSSLNSYLTGDQKPVADPHCVTAGSDYSCPSVTIESPDYDGTYGKNADGIFFFTADTDTYVEWKGPYLFTDAPLKVAQQPIMVREIK